MADVQADNSKVAENEVTSPVSNVKIWKLSIFIESS